MSANLLYPRISWTLPAHTIACGISSKASCHSRISVAESLLIKTSTAKLYLIAYPTNCAAIFCTKFGLLKYCTANETRGWTSDLLVGVKLLLLLSTALNRFKMVVFNSVGASSSMFPALSTNLTFAANAPETKRSNMTSPFLLFPFSLFTITILSNGSFL